MLSTPHSPFTHPSLRQLSDERGCVTIKAGNYTINANHQSDGTDCQSVRYGLRVRSLRNYDGLRKAFPLSNE